MHEFDRRQEGRHEPEDEFTHLNIPRDDENHPYIPVRPPPTPEVRHQAPHLGRAEVTAFVLGALAALSFDVNKPYIVSVARDVHTAIQQIVEGHDKAKPSIDLASLPLQEIAKEEGLQSLLVKDLESGKTFHFNGAQSPIHTASTLKLVIAKLVIDKVNSGDPSFTLDTVLPPVTEEVKGREDGEMGYRYSVRQALTDMLERSHNTPTNVLVRALGGRGAPFTAQAAKAGFPSAEFPNYFSTDIGRVNKNHHGTLVDISRALELIFKDGSEAGKIAQRALMQAERDYKYPNQIAHKAGDNSKVLGEVGVVEVKGRRFIVGAFAETATLGEDARRPAISQGLTKVVSKLSQSL